MEICCYEEDKIIKLDVTKISEQGQKQIPEQIALYHKYNDLIRRSDYYHFVEGAYMKKLKIDNPFFSLMDKIGDLVILNILWLACCLPVITIGAAATALFDVALKISAGDDPVIFRTFFKAFKENFKQSTWTFLLLLVTGALLLIDFLAAPTFQNLLGTILMVGSVAFGILWFWALVYVFPVQLTFHENIKGTLKRSLLISFQNLPYTIVISVLVLLPIITSFAVPELTIYLFPFFLVIGSSCIALGTAYFFNKIFAKYEQGSSL